MLCQVAMAVGRSKGAEVVGEARDNEELLRSEQLRRNAIHTTHVRLASGISSGITSRGVWIMARGLSQECEGYAHK